MLSNGKFTGKETYRIYSIPQNSSNQVFRIKLENIGNTPFICQICKELPDHNTWQEKGEVYYPGQQSIVALNKTTPNLYMKLYTIGSKIGSGEVNYQLQGI